LIDFDLLSRVQAVMFLCQKIRLYQAVIASSREIWTQVLCGCMTQGENYVLYYCFAKAV